MNKNIRATIIFVLLCFISACSSNKPMDRNFAEQTPQPGTLVFSSERSIIKSAHLTLKVESLTDSRDAITQKVENAAGYVDEFRSHDDTQFTMAIRIPSAKLDAFLDGLDTVGDITSKSISSRDVTVQLVDASANLKNLIALRERYRELLAKAKDVNDLLEIEKELSNVQTKIDLLDGQIKSLESSVALSLVDLVVNRKRILGPIGYIGKGFIWVIGKMFVIQ